MFATVLRSPQVEPLLGDDAGEAVGIGQRTAEHVTALHRDDVGVLEWTVGHTNGIARDAEDPATVLEGDVDRDDLVLFANLTRAPRAAAPGGLLGEEIEWAFGDTLELEEAQSIGRAVGHERQQRPRQEPHCGARHPIHHTRLEQVPLHVPSHLELQAAIDDFAVGADREVANAAGPPRVWIEDPNLVDLERQQCEAEAPIFVAGDAVDVAPVPVL